MQYRSTRGGAEVSAADAIARGIGRNGGLFVPEAFPSVSAAELAALGKLDYRGLAEQILARYLSGCFTEAEIADCAAQAYTREKFSGPCPAPVAAPGEGPFFLELWHGPTCAFKDMALQLLPHLLTRSLKKIRSGKEALILTATSGDTGKAALEGFRDVPGTRILVFYPQNGVSAMQERQMRTQEGGNVFVTAVRGNFDDAQAGVKRIFADGAVRDAAQERGFLLSSANSINWGRLLPQIVYYFSAWCSLAASGAVKPGEAVDFCVPTGNFGDILAAYYARKMGLPVRRLLCASNSNNVLTEFLETGVYNRRRPFRATISPSMDILVSSNLERLLFDLTGGDCERVSAWMRQLAETGSYRVEDDVMEKMRGVFSAGFCSDAETREEIGLLWRERHYLCDPHTAVASRVLRRFQQEHGTGTRAVVVSTASPYKFAPDVLAAVAPGERPDGVFGAVRRLSALTAAPVPASIAALEKKPLRFSRVCGKDEMAAAVLDAAARKG